MVELNEQQNLFKDVILEEVGEIPFSGTQKLRVLIVTDELTGRPMISCQKWWRKDRNSDWVAGKGFKLENNSGSIFSAFVSQACERLETYSK